MHRNYVQCVCACSVRLIVLAATGSLEQAQPPEGVADRGLGVRLRRQRRQDVFRLLAPADVVDLPLPQRLGQLRQRRLRVDLQRAARTARPRCGVSAGGCTERRAPKRPTSRTILCMVGRFSGDVYACTLSSLAYVNSALVLAWQAWAAEANVHGGAGTAASATHETPAAAAGGPPRPAPIRLPSVQPACESFAARPACHPRRVSVPGRARRPGPAGWSRTARRSRRTTITCRRGSLAAAMVGVPQQGAQASGRDGRCAVVVHGGLERFLLCVLPLLSRQCPHL